MRFQGRLTEWNDDRNVQEVALARAVLRDEAEATGEKCGVPDMDGNHDGIPCERQWCN